MLLRKLVVIGLVGFVSLATSIAAAQQAAAPGANYVGASGVSFADDRGFGHTQVNFSSDSGDGVRFANMSLLPPSSSAGDDQTRHYEVSVVARAAANIDVAFAHTRGVGFDQAGDVSRESQGSEVRIGHGLQLAPSRDGGKPSRTPRWYAFVASDQQALIWQPGARNDFGTPSSEFALQDRVEIGDMQAGVTYEVYGIQTSLAYVERKMRTHVGGRTYMQDDNFAGITVTIRR